MRYPTALTPTLLLILLPSASPAGEKPAAQPERDAAFAKLSSFVGGVWTNDNPKFVIEFRYEWVLDKTALRGFGTIDKGGPKEIKVESTLGWDPAKKSLYYLDFHGGQQIYFGTVKIKGDEFQYDFESIVGPPGKFRSTAQLTTPDTYEFTILAQKDGDWVPAHKLVLKRKKG